MPPTRAPSGEGVQLSHIFAGTQPKSTLAAGLHCA